MARLEFWISPTESISWHLAAQPELGSEVVLSDGVYRVVAQRTTHDPNARAYDVERVRDATLDEISAAAIALNDLRMMDDWD